MKIKNGGYLLKNRLFSSYFVNFWHLQNSKRFQNLWKA